MERRPETEASRAVELLPAELCAELVAESEDIVCGVLPRRRHWLKDVLRRPLNTFGLISFGAHVMFKTGAAFVGFVVLSATSPKRVMKVRPCSAHETCCPKRAILRSSDSVSINSICDGSTCAKRCSEGFQGRTQTGQQLSVLAAFMRHVAA